LQKLQAMVTAQGGKGSLSDIPQAPYKQLLVSPSNGYIQSMDTHKWGIAAMMLGAGRERIEDEIDHTAGIILHKKPGDSVTKGDSLAEFHTSQSTRFPEASATALEGITITSTPPEKTSPLIFAQVDKHGTHFY